MPGSLWLLPILSFFVISYLWISSEFEPIDEPMLDQIERAMLQAERES